MAATKLCKTNGFEDGPLLDISTEILELKKRIQLSEGQRKALFEQIETESKRDADEMFQLKKEIARLTIVLQEQRGNMFAKLTSSFPPLKPYSAPCRKLLQQSSNFIGSRSAGNTRTLPNETMPILRGLMGPNAGHKTLEEIVHHLDLQSIDKNKQLDLLRYQWKQKECKLKKLAEEYEKCIVQQRSKADNEATCHDVLIKEFRNRINAVQDQIIQAEHVRRRYKEIRTKLVEDAAKFESKMLKVEEDLRQQTAELEKMKQANLEAVKLRSEARRALQMEEKLVLAASADREKQSTEGKRLVEVRKRDLETMEKYACEAKAPTNGNGNLEEDEPGAKVADPMQEMKQNVEILMEATGSTCLEDVLEKVKEQVATQAKLTALRKSKEIIKHSKQRKYDAMLSEFEKIKFTEDDKLTEANSQLLNEISSEIKTVEEKNAENRSNIHMVEDTIKRIVDKLHNTYICLHHGDGGNVTKDEPLMLIKAINEFIKCNKKQHLRIPRENTIQNLLEEVLDAETVNWLPDPYNEIVLRTPQSTSNVPSPLPQQKKDGGGSEDDEELPTRGYLKRQAQLVVDAKNKRKTMRFPIMKTK